MGDHQTMAIKKSELYSSIWKSCDQLRGGMDATQYKDYVLFMLFIKYISDKYAGGGEFAPVVIPEGASFADMVALRNSKDIGDKINKKIINPLVKANEGQLGRNDFPDFNDSNKLGRGAAKINRLTKLINIFNEMPDLSKNHADGDDILGDAYEYLMRRFATQSGKSKGQFYTPAEVSRVIAQVIGISPQNTKLATTAYDPTCGSGSLLLKVAARAEKKITLEGQEKDVTTAGLARMNMILHGFDTASIHADDTLAAPHFKGDNGQLRTYDYVVANPPFSDKEWSTGIIPSEDEYNRFKWGVPPDKQGDYAYLLHIIRSMKSNGKGACILPHGVLFRGNAEAGIRENLVRHGYLKGIIGLPGNLFYGTGIPACIIVLDKENVTKRNEHVFMIDASKGFMKDGDKNRLREQDIRRIVDTFTNQKWKDIPRYARKVSLKEIESNEFNLNLPRYIDSAEPEDIQDIGGHLRGGIPEHDLDALGKYWQVFPGVREALFQTARPGYAKLRAESSEVQTAILSHDGFVTFQKQAMRIFDKWRKTNTPRLDDFQKDDKPKTLLDTLADDLLAGFRRAPLLDEYNIYQHLMDYREETMLDDVYLIAAEGWKSEARELVPEEILVAKYFAAERDAIEDLDNGIAVCEERLAEMREEHGGEDGMLANSASGENGKQKFTEQSLYARWQKIENDPLHDDEREVIQEYLATLNRQTDAKIELKEARKKLNKKIDAKYSKLTERDIKTLVIDDKWLAHLSDAVRGELDSVAQTLTARIRELAERYDAPLTDIAKEVNTLTARVDKHLQKMGAL